MAKIQGMITRGSLPKAVVLGALLGKARARTGFDVFKAHLQEAVVYHRLRSQTVLGPILLCNLGQVTAFL